MSTLRKHIASLVSVAFALLSTLISNAQTSVDPSRIPPRPSMEEIMKDWGPYDTIVVGAIWYGTDYDSFKIMPYAEEENVWISKLPPAKLEQVKREYNRLRNAVYVCYPYARIAGNIINQINKELETAGNKKDRKAIIKSREKELKQKFAEPLSNLSVYQGKVLMKLINRQTGNNCYEILKEYKGSLNARLYQTIAFFYGGNLKQEYNLKESFDREIENFVREIDASWYNNPYRNPSYIYR
ncbi:hypothetical protein PIECOFPK_02695 [Mycovorax composti]|uniref:DUF4294 domain-containing protein n=1 Tax=Mycovorax composti TaxID=2962693 RepID=A0ABZ2ENB0_9BACT